MNTDFLPDKTGATQICMSPLSTHEDLQQKISEVLILKHNEQQTEEYPSQNLSKLTSIISDSKWSPHMKIKDARQMK